MKNKRILVTGGTGVLGTYIVRALLADGFTNIEVLSRSAHSTGAFFSNSDELTFTQGDVTELYPLEDAIQRADYIIHAAAIVSFSPRKFDKMHSINVDGTANVLNLALANNVTKVVHISSIAAIGRSENEQRISEKTKWSNSKYNSYYGITKYLAEQEAWRAHHEGLNIAIVNPALVLGDGKWDQSSLQIFKKTYNGLPYYPTGGTSIVDVLDVSKIILHLLKSDVNGERFIASAGNISYQSLFTKMALAMKVKPPKKAAPKWMLSILWRIEKVRTFFSNSEPLVTKESVKSTAHMSQYDNTKSLSLGWGEYRDIEKTISQYSEAFVQSNT